jgi:hypothetical protein
MESFPSPINDSPDAIFDAKLRPFRDSIEKVLKNIPKSSVADRIRNTFIHEIIAWLETAKRHMDYLDQENASQLLKDIDDWKGKIEDIDEQLPNKCLNKLDDTSVAIISGLKKYRIPVAIALLSDLGHLNVENVSQSFENIAEKILVETKKKAAGILAEAEEDARTIELNARGDAAGHGFSTVKEHFSNACQLAEKKAEKWYYRFVCIFSIVLFLIAIFLSYPPDQSQNWLTIYNAGIRLGLLGVLGGIMAFSLRMMRAYLHISEQHKHRSILAESVKALVEGTADEEFRKEIFRQTLHELTTFGATGFVGVKEEGGMVPDANIMIDAVKGVKG